MGAGPKHHRRLEAPRRRGSSLLAAVVAIGLTIVALVALIVFFNSRDDAGVVTQPAPGREAEKAAGYDLVGGDVGVPIARDRTAAAPRQVAGALAKGNVVIAYQGDRPPRALVDLQDELSGPYDPEIAAAGLAVILLPARSETPTAITALAAGHVLDVDSATDPELRRFVEYWLSGASERG